MRHLLPVLFSLFLLFAVNVSHASTVSDLFGDQDGFGLGISDGEIFDWAQLNGATPDDDGITDTWIFGSQNWLHTYSLEGLGPITSASLEILSGGTGPVASFGLADVYIDGQIIGTLSEGINYAESSNAAYVDYFDLMPYVSLLNEANSITIVTHNNDSWADSWALDYSLLTISDEGGPPLSPEPLSSILFVSGGAVFAGRCFWRKRKKGFKVN